MDRRKQTDPSKATRAPRSDAPPGKTTRDREPTEPAPGSADPGGEDDAYDRREREP